MTRALTIPALALAAGGFAALGGTAFAQEEQAARCTLTYKESVNASGPCTIRQEDPITSIKGTVEENGQTYIAVLDKSKGEGLLIGAGTFTLADGKLAEFETDKAVWRNGYVLTFEPE